MAAYEATESQIVSATTTSQEATFDGGIQGVYIAATGDIHVDFDRPATTSSMLVKANQNPFEFGFRGGNVKKIHVRTVSSTATVYLLGIRGDLH